MVKNYLEQFYTDAERQELTEINDKLEQLNDKSKSVYVRHCKAINLYNEVKKSDLEIGETEQERQERLKKLYKDSKDLARQQRGLEKKISDLLYQRDSINWQVFARYTEQTDDADILQNCLQIIKEIEPGDVIKGEPPIDDFISDGLWTPTDWTEIIRFSWLVANGVVSDYLNYFEDVKNTSSLFKIMNCLYDRTLEFYPDGLTDADKENPFCIFDKSFFKALKADQDKQDKLNYEIEAFQTFKKKSPGHVIPSSVKISTTMFALNMIGSRHQITIDEILQSNKANDLVTFKGLDDDGLQFVFNETVATKDTVLVSFKNLETASGGGTAPSKVFIMVLEKMNELGYFYYKVTDQAVTVSVNDLIDSGAFSSKPKAKDALVNARKTLSVIMVNFYNRRKGLDVDVNWFSSIGWKDKSTLLVTPNKDINWRLIGGHFAIYPPYIYRLKTHAYKLAYYIFTQARINKAPNQDGDIEFNLKLTTISRELGLPTVDQVSNFRYKQLILDKIILAMKELTDTDHDYYGESRLVLKINSDIEKTPPKEIIENASLAVTIKKGELTEVYQKIRDHKVDLIESARRKKAKQKRLEKENQSVGSDKK